MASTFTLKSEGLASYKAWVPKEWWQWLIGLVTVGLMAKYFFKGLKDVPSDFASFWWAGRLLIEGKDIYTPVAGVLPNVYLPLHSILMAPLALLPINFAFLLWQIGQLLALWASFNLLERLIPKKEQKKRCARFWLTLLLALPPLLSNWAYGQYNHLLLLGTLITLKWLSEGREWMSGLVMGFLLSIKPFQLLSLLLLTVLKGLWRFILACIGTICFGIVFLPSILWGFKKSILLLARWHDQISHHAIWFGWESRSLTVTLYRLLTPCNVSSQPDHPITVNVLNFTPAFALGIITVTALLIFTLVVWHCRNPMTLMDKRRFLWETSLILTATLLLSTRTEMHHGVMLIPTFWLLADYIARRRKPWWLIKGVTITAWMFYALLNSDLIPKFIREILRTAYWAHGFALLLFFIALLKIAPQLEQDKGDGDNEHLYCHHRLILQ